MRINFEVYRRLFKQLDGSGANFLEFDELVKSLQELNIEMSAENVKQVTGLIGESGKQKLNVEEFCRFMYICENCATASDMNASMLFLAADKDYSFSANAEELYVILKRLEFNVTKEDIQEAMSELADNTDGTISYQMFCCLVQVLQKDLPKE